MVDKASKELYSHWSKILAFILTAALLFAAALYSLFVSYSVGVVLVKGSSMEPTLSEGSMAIVQKENNFSQDQLVVFNRPKAWASSTLETHDKLVKRIAAVPGDRVEITSEGISVNDTQLYAFATDTYTCSKAENPYSFTVPANSIFVMGDNHTVSVDSLREYCSGSSSYFVSEDLVDIHGNLKLVIG